MPKEPLYPHIPGKKEPLFPHVPKGQQPEGTVRREGDWVYAKVGMTEVRGKEDPRGILIEQVSPTYDKGDFGKAVAIIEKSFGVEVTELPASRYEFFPESVRRKLPPIGATGEQKDPIAQVKFFTPWTSWTWYGLEFDGRDIFFGWVVGLEKEFGSFSLSELQSLKGPAGLKIERDIYFEPKPISQVMKEHGESLSLPQIELLAKTEGDPLRKFCCRQCGECALPELLEEGRFPDRIAWLRNHYKEKHPGIWGKRLPMTATTKSKPTRDNVEIGTWEERDRIGIWLIDKRTDKVIAEWWDEDAREMFDQGFFKPGDIRHQTITGRAFEDSVLDYAESVGILAGGGRFLPQTVKGRQPIFPHTLKSGVVTITCPICGKVIEIPEYNKVTRTEALGKHLKEEHPKHPLLTQVTIEGREQVPPQYRHLIGLISEPLPKEAD